MRTFFASIGANATQLRNSWGVTLTTALDQLQVLKQLTPLGTTLTPETIALMNSILAGVTPSQHWGVSGGVPADVPVWLKNGWLYDSATGNDYSGTSSWTVNSIGNVGDRYLIAILSEGNPVGSNRAEQHGIERLETLAGGEAEPGKAGQSEDRDPEGATSGNCGGGPIGRFTMRGKPTHDATPQNQTAARKAAAKYSRR